MTRLKKLNYLKWTATLLILCLASPGLISVLQRWAQDKVCVRQTCEEFSNLKEVYPSANSFLPVRHNNKILYYKALDHQKKVLGYVFEASAKGYSGDIVTMAAVDLGGTIVRIKILSQNETPGLGARITEAISGNNARSWFQERFSGKKIESLDRSVDAIAGATVSSKAVIDSIQKRAKEILGKE